MSSPRENPRPDRVPQRVPLARRVHPPQRDQGGEGAVGHDVLVPRAAGLFLAVLRGGEGGDVPAVLPGREGEGEGKGQQGQNGPVPQGVARLEYIFKIISLF